MSTLGRNYCFVMLFCAALSSFAQVKKLGTSPVNQNNTTINQKNNHLASTLQAGSTAPTQCLNKRLSLAIHIITDSLNHTNITQSDINTGLATLNADFAPICLSFFICKQDTIYNYKYYQFDQVKETPEVHAIYEVHNMINVYIVGSIVPAPEAGFASMGADYMVLTHGCVTDGKCWSHEMGHFFSLPHTFDTSVGAELVNESNCSTAGDLICDTPADINPAPVSGACQWTGTNVDANGNFYTPIIGNIMSYHPSGCKTPFTVGQLNNMLNYFISYRNYLY
ncbi:MAG: M43 family zinc metalloprotease [Bacteroidia bacterium]